MSISNVIVVYMMFEISGIINRLVNKKWVGNLEKYNKIKGVVFICVVSEIFINVYIFFNKLLLIGNWWNS